MNADKRGWLLAVLALLLSGCGDSPSDGSENNGLFPAPKFFETTEPDAKLIESCREEMCLSPDLVIQPQGLLYIDNFLDDGMLFKFDARAENIADVFQADVVDTENWKPGFELFESVTPENSTPLDWWNTPDWWNAESKPLIGGRANLPNNRFMDVGYADNGDGTLTVYIIWNET